MLFQVLPCPANCSALFGTPDLAGVFTTTPPLNPCHPHPASPPIPPQSHNNHPTLHQSLSPFSTVISLIVCLALVSLPSVGLVHLNAKYWALPKETPYCAWLKANAAPSQNIPIILTTRTFHQGFSTNPTFLLQ